MALTMTDGQERLIRSEQDDSRDVAQEHRHSLLAELDATRARVAEVERQQEDVKHHLVHLGLEPWHDGRSISDNKREWQQHIGMVLSSLVARLAAREAECVELRAFAAFGSWVFENFWHDGEPGDIEAYDAQEKAAEFGLLGRTSEVDAGATHAEGCDYSPDAPPTECCCFTPTRRPLDVARLLPPATQAQGENERENG